MEPRLNTPEYWALHKKAWQEEYDNLTPEERRAIMDDVNGPIAMELEQRILICMKKMAHAEEHNNQTNKN